MRRSMLRRWHARTGLAVLLVIVAAVLAATASAGRTSVLTGAPYSPACGVGTSFLDSLAARGGGARGEGREPNLNQVLEEVPAGQAQSTANFDATIPVYIHVIRTGTAVAQGNVPDAWIHDQIHVLNMSYGGFYGGADTGFRFELAAVDRTTNARWFNMTPGGEDEYKAKRALRRGGADALNIYTVDGGKYLGWAYFPSGYASRPYVDGVIIAFGSMPGSTIPGFGNYNLGFTATHEAGRWARARPHVPGRLQRQGRPCRRHARREETRLRVPGRPGHLPRGRGRSDPQLHGLLG